MESGCLICGAELEYLDREVKMECSICGNEFMSKTKCSKGHFVCDSCHMKGADRIVSICLAEDSKNPIEILEELMSQGFCHMHGPEHHMMVGCSLLTAYYNAGGYIDLEESLKDMISRGSCVPGGACGFWGACGAGISTGMFVSIVTGSNPMAEETWAQSQRMTSASLSRIAGVNGPRCCKRDSYLAILTAIDFCKDELGVEMERSDIECSRFLINRQCIGERCPFHPDSQVKEN